MQQSYQRLIYFSSIILIVVVCSLIRASLAAPTEQHNELEDSLDLLGNHDVEERGSPMRLRFGKRDPGDAWTVLAQRSLPSLRLRFGKRDNVENPWSQLQRGVNLKSSPGLRLRFGKRQVNSQDLNSEDSWYGHQIGARSSPGFRLRFGKREMDSQDPQLQDPWGLYNRDVRTSQDLRLRFGRTVSDPLDFQPEESMNELQRENRSNLGSSSGLRLRFGKRQQFNSQEMQPQNSWDEAIKGPRMDLRSVPGLRLRFGKREAIPEDPQTQEAVQVPTEHKPFVLHTGETVPQ